MVNRQITVCASERIENCPMTPGYTSNSLLSDKPAASGTQYRPFPTENLAPELVDLILYHVLSEPEFGGNGRWASRDQATREKIQWSNAHKVSQILSPSKIGALKYVFFIATCCAAQEVLPCASIMDSLCSSVLISITKVDNQIRYSTFDRMFATSGKAVGCGGQ
jgi:hypothetical protein